MKRFGRIARAVGRAAAIDLAVAHMGRLPRVAPVAMRAGGVSRLTHVRGFAALPAHTLVPMPALSPTMTAGTIAKWNKNEGDALNPGDVIAQIETDKATVDFECQDSGFLAKILVAGGSSDVAVGRLVAVMVDTKEAAAAFAAVKAEDVLAQLSGGGGAAAAAAAPAPAPAPAAAAVGSAAPAAAAAAAVVPASAAAAPGGRVVASPYARKLAAAAGVNVASLAGGGSGPGGRIIAADVKEYKPPAAAPAAAATAAAAAVAPAASSVAAAAAPAASSSSSSLYGDARSGFKDVPQSNVRRVIAHRLTQSKQTVPHYYLTSEVCLDNLTVVRSQLNAELPADAKLSVNDFLIKASALACKRVPEVNSAWLGDVIRAYDFVDISVAVAIPDGLITPIVRDAHTKGLSSISRDVKGLVEKARAKKLAPEEYQGGTFTISNLGMFGIKTFAAIINPPQAAILAVGGAERKVVPDTTPGAASPFKPSLMMNATLSCDHRVVDGAVGAQWLAAFKGYIEDPKTMLL